MRSFKKELIQKYHHSWKEFLHRTSLKEFTKIAGRYEDFINVLDREGYSVVKCIVDLDLPHYMIALCALFDRKVIIPINFWLTEYYAPRCLKAAVELGIIETATFLFDSPYSDEELIPVVQQLYHKRKLNTDTIAWLYKYRRKLFDALPSLTVS